MNTSYQLQRNRKKPLPPISGPVQHFLSFILHFLQKFPFIKYEKKIEEKRQSHGI